MVVQERLLRKLSDVFNRCQTADTASTPSQEKRMRMQYKAQSEWFGAIAALETIILADVDSLSETTPCISGLLLAGPLPILSHPHLISRFQSGIFTPEACQNLSLIPFQLPACQSPSFPNLTSNLQQLPLFPQDPLITEQFCLVLTSHFSLLMVLGEDSQKAPAFQFSFAPEMIQQGWTILRSRLMLTQPDQLLFYDELFEQFFPSPPDYRLVMEFSSQLLKHLPIVPPGETRKTRWVPNLEKEVIRENFSENKPPELELLQALTHEIRTPLTTIRTMTRLLLKRAKLTPEMSKCLEIIEQECNDQIDRMELIFRAAELETTTLQEKAVQLVPTSLEEVFQNSIPRWQKQAQRRNVNLDFILPKKLPQVVSDPNMLDQMLTGLIEKFTRSVCAGGAIRVQITTAGHQLKLQFHCQSNYTPNPLKSLGQLLMFQPETGSLSLNLNVTKNLFNLLGGKLIVRHHPEQGEVMTIYLPLGMRL